MSGFASIRLSYSTYLIYMRLTNKLVYMLFLLMSKSFQLNIETAVIVSGIVRLQSAAIEVFAAPHFMQIRRHISIAQKSLSYATF